MPCSFFVTKRGSLAKHFTAARDSNGIRERELTALILTGSIEGHWIGSPMNREPLAQEVEAARLYLASSLLWLAILTKLSGKCSSSVDPVMIHQRSGGASPSKYFPWIVTSSIREDLVLVLVEETFQFNLRPPLSFSQNDMEEIFRRNRREVLA